MCCFSRHVEHVANTKIFARAVDDRQYVVYAMSLQVPEDLAMILPIPVRQPSPDDAVNFVDLSGYPEFFDALKTGFRRYEPKSAVPPVDSRVPRSRVLKVVEVGSYEASFVPIVGDFGRLDKRFRLPDEVWEKLPSYSEFGFAVFKLKSGEGQQNVHPMAFLFPSALPEGQLFFPTVHIHDGEVHPQAHFDHALYCQIGSSGEISPNEWRESDLPARRFVDIDRATGIVAGSDHCYLLEMVGEFDNADTIV